MTHAVNSKRGAGHVFFYTEVLSSFLHIILLFLVSMSSDMNYFMLIRFHQLNAPDAFLNKYSQPT